MFYINWIAVIISAVVSYGIGAIWYHEKVFGKSWKDEMLMQGLKKKDGHSVQDMVKAFVMTLIYVFFLAIITTKMEYSSCLADGVKSGLMLGAGIVAMAQGIHYTFGGKSNRIWMIDAGYIVVISVVSGGIIGVLA